MALLSFSSSLFPSLESLARTSFPPSPTILGKRQSSRPSSQVAQPRRRQKTQLYFLPAALSPPPPSGHRRTTAYDALWPDTDRPRFCVRTDGISWLLLFPIAVEMRRSIAFVFITFDCLCVLCSTNKCTTPAMPWLLSLLAPLTLNVSYAFSIHYCGTAVRVCRLVFVLVSPRVADASSLRPSPFVLFADCCFLPAA